MYLSVYLLTTLMSLSYTHSYTGYYGDSRHTDSDRYGRYYYDRSGYKRYTGCYDRLALPRDDCRVDRTSRYDDYHRDSYYGNSYDRYDRDYYRGSRGRINVGRGTFRVINGQRDAELTCEFPRGSHIISNIIWERVKDRDYNRYNSLNSWLGSRMRVERLGNYGSVLIIRDYEPRDEGVYRCVGTRTYDTYTYSSYDRTETVYMEVQFFPRDGRRPYRDDGYSGYFTGRDTYYPTSGYWRTAGLSGSKDTVVTIEDGAKSEETDTNNKE